MQSVPASHRAVVRVFCVYSHLQCPKKHRQTKSNALGYVGANVGPIDSMNVSGSET